MEDLSRASSGRCYIRGLFVFNAMVGTAFTVCFIHSFTQITEINASVDSLEKPELINVYEKLSSPTVAITRTKRSDTTSENVNDQGSKVPSGLKRPKGSNRDQKPKGQKGSERKVADTVTGVKEQQELKGVKKGQQERKGIKEKVTETGNKEKVAETELKGQETLKGNKVEVAKKDFMKKIADKSINILNTLSQGLGLPAAGNMLERVIDDFNFKKSNPDSDLVGSEGDP